MLKSRRILALVVALVMTVGMLPTSAFAAEPVETEQGHVHTADCYAETLTCGLDEHTHGDDCYTISETPAQDEDNGGSEENSGSDDAGAAEPEPAPDAGSEDSGDQGGENESSDSEGESGETSGSDSADSGDSAPAEEPSAPAESAPAEETNIADEPAPLAAAPAKELTCSLEEHTHGEGCYEQTLVCGLEEDEEAEAPEANGGAAATEEPSEAVQAFLEAVAQLPETVDEENVEEIEPLLQQVLEMFGQLTEEEQEREDVMNAQAKALSLWEQLEGVKAETMVEGPAAKIGDVEYETLQLAIRNADANGEVVLLKNVTESVLLPANGVTLDLNGYTLTGVENSTINIMALRTGDLTIKNGVIVGAEGYRAIVATNVNLTLDNVTMNPGGSLMEEGLQSSSFGGGCVYIDKGSLNVKNCTFSGDAGKYKESASYMGAGKFREVDAYGSHIFIGAAVADATIANSTFENSKSTFGAVYAANKSLTVTGSTFSNNGNDLQLNNENGVFAVADSTFDSGAKAINASCGSEMNLNVTNSHFSNFVSGPVINSNGKLKVTGGSFVGNNVGSNGVVQLSGGSLEMDGTKLENNTSGGAVKTYSAADVAMRNVVATGNIGTTSMNSGGSVLNANSIKGKTVILENVTATGNENTKEHGGAFYLGGSNNDANTVIEITNCTLTGNTAKNGGGAIYLNNKGVTTITDTEISGNTANGTGKYAGGGMQVASTSGTVTLAGTTRVYNNETPKATVKHLTVGATADIALLSPTASKEAPKVDFTSEEAVQRATLVLNNETSFTDEDGIQYTLTKSDHKGLHYSSGSGSSKKFYWHVGYYTVKVEPVAVYLNGSHATSDSVILAKTLPEAVQQAQANGAKTIYVCGNVDVLTDEDVEALNSGITFTRCSEHKTGHMFTIKRDATLTNAHIDGNKVEGSASMIFVPSSGHLTIAGDTLIENGKNIGYLNEKGKREGGDGGAIQLSQSGLTMTGGAITNNSAIEGGGIHAYSNYNGAEMIFAGGVISNNKATGGNGGGGAYIGYIPSQFIAGTDGAVTTFSGNESNQLGGGVYLVGNTHKIERAVFTGNKSYRTGYYYDGGAIYVDKGTTAHMKNVYVSGNTDGDPWLANNNYTAVAVCPTGELAVYELDGLLSVNNNGKVDIGVVAGGIVSGADPVVYLPSYAPGGGSVSYTDSKGNPVDISNDHFKQGYFKVKTQASDQAIALAKETAEKSGVVITGNYANQYGAGIMTNGLLKIGTETTTLRVNKVWADGNENHDGDQILVYLTQDGEIVDEDFRADSSVILNKDNNWSYTWTNLGDEFTWGVKEASVPGYTSEVKVEKDTQFKAIADKFYVATITNTSTPDENANKLVIRKTAMGLDPDASYKFTLKLDNVGDQIFALQLDGTLYPIYNNEITFYLKDQQSAVVDGLPDGFTYEVTEEESAEYTAYVFESVTANEGGAGQIKTVDVVNMPTTRVEVTKTWEDDGNAQNTRPESITVNLLANGKKEGFAVITPDADGQWKHTFTGLPKFDAENNEIRYTVEEEPVDGYEATYEGSNITNRYQWGSLTIQKKVEGVATGEQMFKFVVTGPHDYRKEVTLKAGESETLEKLIPGTYHVEEIKDSANVPLYSVEVKGEGDVIVEKDKNSSTTITNAYTPLPGGLTIKKFVEGGPESAQKAEYTFIVTGPQYPNGTEVTVKAGESKTLSDLIPGVYTVREKGAEIDGYELTVEGEGNVEVPKNGSAEATIRNTYTGGSLTISKAVNGGTDYAQNEKVYTFKVTGPDNYSETVTLKGGESKKLENLKAGKYTVEEENASIDGHVWRVEGTGDVTVSAKENTDVAVTNHYVPTDGLSVSKTVTGNGGDRNREFTFVIELTDGDVTLSGVFAVVAEAFVDGVEAPEIKELTFVDGKAEFKLRHGQRVTVQGIPSGVKYVVTETEANQDGYTTTVTGEQGAIVENGNAAAAFINDRTVRRPPDEPDDPDEPDEPDEPNTPDEPDEEIPDEETPLTPGPGPDTEVPTPDVPKTPEEVIELEDPEVPLADMPGEPEEPEVEIPDEDVPLADVPKTGDGSNAQLWLALALASLCGMALVGRKSNENAR